ncbi:MAG: family 16 glycosylhydrolase [Bacteroidia bacterium]
MFKKSTLLLFVLLLVAFSFAQSLHDDFEGNGNISAWAGDDCGADPAFANPFPQNINTSSTVLKYSDTGGQYANVRFDTPEAFDFSDGAVFSFKIFIPSNSLTGSQPNQVSLKLQDGQRAEPWGTQCEIIKPLSLDQWQTVSFDFASDPYINLDPNSPNPLSRKDFNRMLIQVNGENNNDQVTAYIDDFVYSGKLDSWPVYDRLIWADECNGNGLIDTSKWFHQTLLPDGKNWYNGELQHYTDRLDNSWQQNGAMHISAKRERFTDQGETKEFTSARLNSKFTFTYGRVEARIKLPRGGGTWPAFWMLGKNIIEPGAYWTDRFGTTPWPACGEIDIMEHWGNNQNYVSSALHTPSSSGSTVNVGGITLPDASDAYHVYAVDWTPARMRFSVDGNVFYIYDPVVRDAATWPFDDEMYILLNVAIESSVDPNFIQSPMDIDYVRVYQESTVSVEGEHPLEALRVFPNPVENKLFVSFPSGLRQLTARLYSSDGRLLRELQLDRFHREIDCAGLAPGIYQAVFDRDGHRVGRKVVVR